MRLDGDALNWLEDGSRLFESKNKFNKGAHGHKLKVLK